jgi:formate hydrogenlyase subunit 6/NADH:ubiquinone oxidoreductase subunit I
MKLPKVRELLEAIKSLSHRPYTSKFPFKPHQPYPSFRGQPKYNPEKCLGCLACEEICPAEAIAHEDDIKADTPKRVMIHYTDSCIFCGCCQDACIADNEGIRLSNDWELSFFNRAEAFETIEKELQLCEICGSAIACKDHLKWIAEKIGELSYSNPTLYQSRLKGLGVVDDSILSASRDYGRADRIKILCARCRRDTSLTTAAAPVRTKSEK